MSPDKIKEEQKNMHTPPPKTEGYYTLLEQFTAHAMLLSRHRCFQLQQPRKRLLCVSFFFLLLLAGFLAFFSGRMLLHARSSLFSTGAPACTHTPKDYCSNYYDYTAIERKLQ